MNVEKLANKARNSIGRYCFEECQAFCCQKGYLALSKEEMILIVKDKKIKLEKNNGLKKTDKNNFVLDLGNPLHCPNLKNFKCTIHKNPHRPKGCKEFPLFIINTNTEKNIRLDFRCPAVKKGMFYPYIHKFKKLGFRIIE